MSTLPLRDLRPPCPFARAGVGGERRDRPGRRRLGLRLGLALTAALSLAPIRAWAGDREAASAWFRSGLERERAGDYAAALEAFDACAAEEPSAPSVPAALARARELRARAEGGFVPLARLRAFLALRAPTEADAVALADAADGFPDGRVRAEARLAAAVALRHGASRDDLAEPLLRAAHADRWADRSTRALALSELVAILRGRADPEGALAVAREDPAVAPSLVRELSREVRRGRVTWASWALVSAHLLVGLVSLAVVLRREHLRGEPDGDPRAQSPTLAGVLDRTARAVAPPAAIAAVAWIGLGAAVLVRIHGAGDVKPFLFVGLAALPMVVASRAWHVASEPSGPPYRIFRGVVAFVGALALGFVALARSDVKYLESFGW